ncbi:permease [Gardnerella vaginalis]|uniref:Putative permease n=1 Tax=Gardnerella vaginalis (strain ATCC 14019 / 317) TaxID=525284 RepID=E3D7T5_GARV3|nr:permease [Gardnerella vaginalis]ADP38243.1 putative permease [Gardnerella vaginalis ATCC 14019]EIK74347.1 permease [Gardnerella vaginalis 75712]KOS09252.1 permease [Gardnerella vaginalis]NSX25270.1 permease [Gardnerella vaginalis]PKZ54337.1 permease [Gardnerella vaginalis]
MLKTETEAKTTSQVEKASKAEQANSANYLYLIIGIPFISLIIAMFPALQARNPWMPVNTIIMGVAGLLLQAVPFTLIGVLVSAAVETWITADFIEKHAPKSIANGFLAAILAGVCVPVCDCVVVPTFSRLVARKLPLPCAVTFLCAVPVVNPVSIWATWYAFADVPAVAVTRVALGVGVALLVGISFVIFPVKSQVLREKFFIKSCGSTCDSCDFDNNVGPLISFKDHLKIYAHHVYADFMRLMPIILFGTTVASIIRVWLGADPASKINTTTVFVAIPAMMLIAYASSLCSSSDAVIARSLAASLPMSSVIVFLLFGPMLDIKNTLMLIEDFKGKFVIRLTATIVVICLLAALLVHLAWGVML